MLQIAAFLSGTPTAVGFPVALTANCFRSLEVRHPPYAQKIKQYQSHITSRFTPSLDCVPLTRADFVLTMFSYLPGKPE